MKNNPDNRKDNVERIQRNIDYTISNIHRANEVIDETSDENAKRELQAKNERREKALEGMRHEIKDEAEYRKNSEH
ncbi:small acid-soluble spore protein (thioredoxin-like protein) [Hydrogenoanaerobacterium saccharovorans]|uniref:Protein Tlp homolog n=1 Tax=Hydrogenoanaerobacterium saccharovorans TaxID=474960 RepID=A0A1H8A0U1_9FIRM|nr:small acid-soluble spore protein Tlp [Hydrogenoanaerobacterium saccharovorans]RPF48246.1 small acid-soluble spore protein (thioredoxin-like protein) [Hydrogenoanaerobacterium saccharovorans]SEM64106.1 small acid-soluble spore protein (thioredoxin-like protein) [Hydrogenoanaerobacterium saccharovorans]